MSERRPLIITIDGDGFIYRHRESGHPVGELIRDRILRAYPFEFTASFIAGDPELYGDRFDLALAREVFALANVEGASHSWSHPHDWTAPGVDAEREIVDSVRYLERQLLAADRRVQAFLWSGLCNPTEDQLRVVESLGIGNLNGGDPLSPYRQLGSRRHYHSRAPNDWVYMDLWRRVASAGCGVEAYLASGSERLDGFSRVIEFFQSHPRLPVHVYFHWYSGARDESLDALRRVLDWCLGQDLESMPASRYLADVAGRERPDPALLRSLVFRLRERWRRKRWRLRHSSGAVFGRRSTASASWAAMAASPVLAGTRGMTFETLPAWWRPPREETPVEGGRTQTAVRRSGFFDLWGAVDAAALAVGPVVRREDDLIAGHTELQWGEHCVECAAPACYEACDLFIPSESGCRRFLHGIGRTDHHATLRDWSYEIVFLPWGNLLAKIGRPLAGFDGFLLQVHNPGPAALTAVVDFRGPSGPNRRRLMWQERLPPGASQFFYPLDRLEAAIGHDGVTEVAIAVDSTAPTTTVVFPFAEFVRWKESAPDAIDAGRVKCVAVDLDNTLWRGTLVEDGAEAVTLDQTMLKQLALLRDRGIVTSIVSKNDAEEAGSVLKRLGIRDQFVFPEIDWGAKSQSVARLAESLGIGIDSIALIDDSSYERAEVQAAQPEVQVLKPSELGFLVRRISRGTRGGLGERRFEFYRDEESRRAARDAVSDHDEFLRSLGTEARISAPAAADVGRVQELVQRTNRLNFSGHRYSRAEIEALLRDPTLRCRTVCARDRFGDYGLVGFLVLGTADPRSWSIRDLMFSCRILGRQVDVFTLVQTIEEARSAGVESLLATFRPSGRNDSARAALETAGFNPRDEESWGFDPQQSEVPRIDTVTAWRDADDRSGAST